MYYGVTRNIFYNWTWMNIDATSSESDAFKFVFANENDGARWAVGDTIDAFALDWAAAAYKDNPGFVLAGSATLAAGGAALLAAVLM